VTKNKKENLKKHKQQQREKKQKAKMRPGTTRRNDARLSRSQPPGDMDSFEPGCQEALYKFKLNHKIGRL
jgi:hypothetical protein